MSGKDCIFIKCDEVIQAGDVFLMSYFCRHCGEKCLGSIKSFDCQYCHELSGHAFELPQKRQGFRLLSGTKRNRTKYTSKKNIRLLLDIQANCCAYCDKVLDQIEVDHVVPLSVGGTNNLENLCLSCPRCNRLAGSKCFASFVDKKKYVLEMRKNDFQS